MSYEITVIGPVVRKRVSRMNDPVKLHEPCTDASVLKSHTQKVLFLRKYFEESLPYMGVATTLVMLSRYPEQTFGLSRHWMWL